MEPHLSKMHEPRINTFTIPEKQVGMFTETKLSCGPAVVGPLGL